jgi:hypothetical protein
MDQLFVSERVPSPTHSDSSHTSDREDEGARQENSVSENAARQGKQPEIKKLRDGPELSYAEYRARRKSSLAGREGLPYRPKDALLRQIEERGEGSTGSEGHGSARRPTLSSRSTEERVTVQNQGLLWDGTAAESPRGDGGADLYTTEDGGGIHRQSPRRSPERPMDASSRTYAPRRYSRPARPYSYAAGMDQGSLLLDRSVSRSSEVSGQMFDRDDSSPEVVVPRWQPDAEVTFCPICRTQFSRSFIS